MWQNVSIYDALDGSLVRELNLCVILNKEFCSDLHWRHTFLEWSWFFMSCWPRESTRSLYSSRYLWGMGLCSTFGFSPLDHWTGYLAISFPKSWCQSFWVLVCEDLTLPGNTLYSNMTSTVQWQQSTKMPQKTHLLCTFLDVFGFS